jgi:hypothetical protein
MASFAEDSAAGLSGAITSAKHALRSFGYACTQLPRLPGWRLTTRRFPLPGDAARIYCYHVRKTGGTSLAHAFLALGGEEPRAVERRMKRPPFCTSSGPYRFAYQDPPLLRHGYFFFAYGHKPAETIRLPAATFTITILRDPVDRVVSLYRYLADRQADAGHAFHALGYERDWAGDGFGPFLDRVSRAQLLNQLYTFSVSGSVTEAAERIARCDRVLFTERLDQGLAELGGVLGLPLAARRDRQSCLDFAPSAGERSRLRELLEPEYRLLSLVGPPPAGRREAPAARPVT